MQKKKNEKDIKKNSNVVLFIILAAFTFGVYYNAINNGFVFDDDSVVLGDKSIISLSNIPKYFTAEEGFHKVIGNYYRPVVSSSYALDYAIWGSKPGGEFSPAGFHITNILIHLISTLLLFTILKLLFSGYKFGISFAFLSALLFGVHTVHTEAVTWISGRTDAMVTMFYLASFLYYIKFAESGSNKKLLTASYIFFILGLLCKEMIVTMPVLILLYDFIYRKKPISYLKENLKPYLGFIIITVTFVILRAVLLSGVPVREKYMYFYGYDFVTVIATMMKTIPYYFKLLLFPVNLIYYYNGYIPDANTFADVKVILSFLFIAALVIISIYLYKNHSPLSFAILFFLISLTPVMNIVPTMSLMAERFLYLGSISLSIALCYTALKISNENNYQKFYISFAVIIVILSFLTVQRNFDWKDNNTLYSTGEGLDGSGMLVNSGNIYANNKKYDEAEKRYRRAIEIRPNNVLAHHNLGLVYFLKGNLDSAEIEIMKGMAIDSLAPDGYFQLSNIYQSKGDKNKAINYLEKLQLISPDYRGSQAILENLKNETGIPGNNSSQKDAMKLQILSDEAHQKYQQGKYDESINLLKELLEADPQGKAGYLNNIAVCYFDMKNYEKASQYYNESLKAKPDNTNAINGLAEIALKKGNKDEAINYYKEVLKVNPSDNNANFKLDSLRAR